MVSKTPKVFFCVSRRAVNLCAGCPPPPLLCQRLSRHVPFRALRVLTWYFRSNSFRVGSYALKCCFSRFRSVAILPFSCQAQEKTCVGARRRWTPRSWPPSILERGRTQVSGTIEQHEQVSINNEPQQHTKSSRRRPFHPRGIFKIYTLLGYDRLYPLNRARFGIPLKSTVWYHFIASHLHDPLVVHAVEVPLLAELIPSALCTLCDSLHLRELLPKSHHLHTVFKPGRRF